MQVKTIKESDKSFFVSYAIRVNTDGEGDETALVVPLLKSKVGVVNQDVIFLILNGDWIDKYKACESKLEQLKLYRDNEEEHGGFWRDNYEEHKDNLSL